LRGFLLKNIYRFSKSGFALLFTLLLIFSGQPTSAQRATQQKDTLKVVLKDSLKTRHLWLLAQVLPGSGQVVNKQYWKIPIYYAGMGSMLALGMDANKDYWKYRAIYRNLDSASVNKIFYEEQFTKAKIRRNLYYAGVGAFYIASVVDALTVYNKANHSPATATILSTILPGSGQVYNHKYWKVPIVYGGLSTLYFIVDWNNRGYIRMKRAIRQYPNDEFGGKRSTEEMKIYRNLYHRNRDVAFVGLVGVYILNIIDANVDANLYNWNVNDDLSLHVEPSILNTNFAYSSYNQPAFGLTLKLNF